MKSNLILLFLLTILTVNAAYSQNQQTVKTFTRSFVDTEFSVDRVYDKATGSKISPNDFRKIIQENPRLRLEKEINEEGHVVRYLYDPDAPMVSARPKSMTNIPEKGVVPNFKIKTIDGNKIELDKLKGKLVIVRFEQVPGDHFKKNEIADLDKKINALKNKENVEAIIIFQCSEGDIRKGFDLQESNFKLIPDGQNFALKYDIHFYPTTLLIDQDGKLIKVYINAADINLEEYVK